jgi:MFS family permease
VFWIGLIVAGCSWPFLLFIPETYGPIILRNRARRLRKTTGDKNIFAPVELEKKSFKELATVTLTRPIRMLFFELIVLTSCLYLSLVYAIFYLFFEAYPLVFEDLYGMTPGISGLAFLPIGVGSIIAICIFNSYDNFLQKARAADKEWARPEEARRLPLACLGGPLFSIALFWLGWTSRASIHWIVPMLAGIPFGVGFVLIFMALLNYLTDAYLIFAASAQAATSCSRSLFGAVLPLAAKPMYRTLGIGWASSLLGFVSLAMCAIPFLFIKYGETIRARSTFCTYLREQKAEEERNLEKRRLKSAKASNDAVDEV